MQTQLAPHPTSGIGVAALASCARKNPMYKLLATSLHQRSASSVHPSCQTKSTGLNHWFEGLKDLDKQPLLQCAAASACILQHHCRLPRLGQLTNTQVDALSATSTTTILPTTTS
jgi:hypothetical protein